MSIALSGESCMAGPLRHANMHAATPRLFDERVSVWLKLVATESAEPPLPAGVKGLQQSQTPSDRVLTARS